MCWVEVPVARGGAARWIVEAEVPHWWGCVGVQLAELCQQDSATLFWGAQSNARICQH